MIHIYITKTKTRTIGCQKNENEIQTKMIDQKNEIKTRTKMNLRTKITRHNPSV